MRNNTLLFKRIIFLFDTFENMNINKFFTKISKGKSPRQRKKILAKGR